MKKVRRMSLLALMAVLLFAFNGCGDDGNDVKSHLNEHDFAQNPSLVATTDDVVIINLEHPDATDVHENDSHVIGIDRIPLYFPEDVIHEFVIEYKEEGDAFFEVLLDEEGNEILCLDRENTTVTENITAGTYTLEIHHGGCIEGAYTLFVRPGSTYTGGDCPGCDLSWTDLRGANLSGANLSHANLHLSLLDSANLSGANLSHADLSGAGLNHSNLTHVDLRGANLTKVLGDADLSDADLSGANLTRANLRHSNLSGANLSGAILSHADLKDANLSGANLSSANLSYAGLADANLCGAILRGANLSGVGLFFTDLCNADLSGATWTDGTYICKEGSIGECL